jgi:thioredoxin 1
VIAGVLISLAAWALDSAASSGDAKSDLTQAEAHILRGEANLKTKNYAEAKNDLLTARDLIAPAPGRASALSERVNSDLAKLPKSLLTIKKVNVKMLGDFAQLLIVPAMTRGIESGATTPKPKVLDFYADWCPPCQMLKPMVEKAKKQYEDKVDFVVLNADDGKTRVLMKQYDVAVLPTLIFVGTDGGVVDSAVGFSGDDNVIPGVKELLRAAAASK